MSLFISHGFSLSGLSLLCLMSWASFSSNAQAQNGSSKKIYESAVFVPWQFLSDATFNPQGQNGAAQLSFDLGAVKLEAQGIPVNLSNIHVDVETQLKSAGTDNNNTLWQAGSMSARISVSGFTVEKTVEQWIRGIEAKIHLKAVCEGFELVQSSAQMNMAWGWSSRGTALEASLSSLDMKWPAGSWKISPIRCQGPSGFGDLLQTEIQKQLANPNQFVEPLKEYLQKYFNEQINASLEQYRKPQWLFSDLQTALVMEMTGVEAAVEKGLVLRGIIHVEKIEAASVQNKEELVALDVEKSLQGIDGKAPALIFPGLAVESLIADVAENRIAIYQLNRFAEFNKLLASKFMQWFVWPDLMNYTKTSVFDVTSKVAGRPTVQYSSDHRMWVQGYVDTWIYSQRQGRPWRYIDIRSGFAAWVTPEIVNGHLKVGLSNTNMKSSAKMADDYVKSFKPRTHLAVSTIEKSIKGADFFKGFSLELPSIELNNGRRLKANRLIRSNKDAFIIELGADSLKGVAGL